MQKSTQKHTQNTLGSLSTESSSMHNMLSSPSWISSMNKRLSHSLLASAFIFAFLSLTFKANAQSSSFIETASADMQNQMHTDEFTLIEVGDNSLPILISPSQQPITKGIVLIIGDADMPLGRKDSLAHIADLLPSIGWTTVVMPSLGLHFGPSIAFPIDDLGANSANSEDDANNANTVDDTNSNNEAATRANAMANIADAGIELSAADTIAADNADNMQADNNANRDVTGEQAENSTLNSKNDRINSLSMSPLLSEAELIVYSQEIEAYLVAVLAHMKNTMGHRIIVSQGISAATIAKLLSDAKPSTQNIDALVINNPYWPIRKLNNQIPTVIAQTPLPVLDLISHWDNNWSKKTQDKRRIRARTEIKEVYRQSEIIGQTFDAAQMEYITHQIKGFTTHLGW